MTEEKPIVIVTDRIRVVKSPGYNMIFRMTREEGGHLVERDGREVLEGVQFIEDGQLLRWGTTEDDDPQWSPVGPELADIEISSGGCDGVLSRDGKPTGCAYCSPAGAPVKTPTGDVPIEQLEVGDSVIGLDLETGKPRIQMVREVYCRDYTGELIEINAEDGQVLYLTPEHEVFLSSGKLVRARELVEGDNVIGIKDL